MRRISIFSVADAGIGATFRVLLDDSYLDLMFLTEYMCVVKDNLEYEISLEE